MEWGTFATVGWSSPPVGLAGTFLERLKGLRPRSDGQGMLIRGGSVHGFGMKEPLLVVGLDQHRRVVGCGTLFPQRILLIRRACEILELPIDREPPPVRAVLTWVGGGSPDSLRNTDRQPE